jgi:signal transduction histidine kinase
VIIKIALILSVVLQAGAFVITVRLITKTRFSIAWISISIGFMLMAIRRITELFSLYNKPDIREENYANSWLAVLISLFMFIASFYISKILKLLNHYREIRKRDEARLLTAVIQTEEKERNHFAKELHDGIGPLLSSMKMSLSALNTSQIDPKNKDILGKTENAVDTAILTTKEISNHLNPVILEKYGLVRAIQSFSAKNILKEISFHIDSQLENNRLDYTKEVVLYRISCELISNTIKHASASKIILSLFEYNHSFMYSYEDNGIGFDTQQCINKGMGLSNIESRVASLNAKLQISSKPQRGMFLKIEIPK